MQAHNTSNQALNLHQLSQRFMMHLSRRLFVSETSSPAILEHDATSSPGGEYYSHTHPRKTTDGGNFEKQHVISTVELKQTLVLP